ncbi:hypothetical protein MXB_1680 [Myxobolus squamalis]|nr:hypothetical protein MXB_1680 [Myxobolus squamalis]
MLLSHNSHVVKYLTCILFSDIFLPPNNLQVDFRFNAILESLQNIFSCLLPLIKPSSNSCSDVPFKCLISVLLHVQSYAKPYLPLILENLSIVLDMITSVSVKPPYIHYLYESFCLSLRLLHIHNPTTFHQLS